MIGDGGHIGDELYLRGAVGCAADTFRKGNMGAGRPALEGAQDQFIVFDIVESGPVSAGIGFLQQGREIGKGRRHVRLFQK